MAWWGAPWSCQTQSALREGLLDLIQHIPKQRRLVTFSVNGHCLTRLGERGESKEQAKVRIRKNTILYTLFIP